MGTPPAAVPSLRAVAAAHEVAAVYTQPDRPSGRGLKVQPSAVKDAAVELGLHVLEPSTLKTPEEHDRLRALAPDAVTVVAYGQILPPEILETPRIGCVNVHFSLLPKWRGAAPVERAIMAGDRLTGITTMLMDPGLDTGPILLQERVAIEPDDTTGTLLERLAEIGAAQLVVTLERLESGAVRPRPQPEVAATYARKIRPEEAEVSFRLPAERIVNQIRALNPEPGAFTWFRARRLKVWRASERSGEGVPGVVVASDDEGPQVQAGRGRLLLEEVQPEGKRRMSGAEFAHGYRPAPGEQLGVFGAGG